MFRLAATFALLLCACGRSHPSVSEPPPTVTLYGMKVTSFRGNDLVAAGRAAKLTYVRTTTAFVGSEVLMRFPSQSKIGMQNGLTSGGMEVRAPTVVGNQAERKAEGQGGVTMRSADGVVAQSDHVFFDGVKRLATGDSTIDVDGPRYSLTSDRFELSFVDQLYRFDGHVHSRLGPQVASEAPEPRR